MTAPTVTVLGIAERRVQPTSVVLHGELVASGGDRQASFDELVVGQQQIAEALGDTVMFTGVTSHDTRDERGWQIHRHAASVEATLDEVARVGGLVTELVGLRVEVHGADWRIPRDAPVHREVRTAAVVDGAARAHDYAAAVGMVLGPLVSVTDGAGRGELAGPVALARHAAGDAQLSLAPQPVLVTASAQLRYQLVDH